MTDQEQAELTALRKLEAEARDMREAMVSINPTGDNYVISDAWIEAIDDALALVDGVRSE